MNYKNTCYVIIYIFLTACLASCALTGKSSGRDVFESQTTAQQEAERLATAQQEAERLATAQQEAERLATAQQEAERLATAQQEAERLATAQQEAERLATAQQEAERLATAQQEAERLATAQQEAERLATAQQEAERLATAQQEAERLATAQQEAERLATAQQEAERLATAQQEAGRLATAQQEAERLATAQQEGAKVSNGSAVYYIPKEMTELQAYPVELWVDNRVPLDDLLNEFSAKLNLEAKTLNALKLEIGLDNSKKTNNRFSDIAATQLTVSKYMYAELTGGKGELDIRPEGKVRQSLEHTGRAIWPWFVTPLNSSNELVNLKINIWIDPDGTGALTKSYTEIVQVHPKAKSLYERLEELNSWLTLLGLGGITGVMLFIKSYFANRRKQNLHVK